MTNIDKLTELQKTLGYKEGEINPIAILGLFGEAGEVLEEWFNLNKNEIPIEYHYLIKTAIDKAASVDKLKKKIRKNEIAFPKTINVSMEFLAERSDTLYYLNGLSIGSGDTIDQIAAFSVDKVTTRIAKNKYEGVLHKESPDWPGNDQG